MKRGPWGSWTDTRAKQAWRLRAAAGHVYAASADIRGRLKDQAGADELVKVANDLMARAAKMKAKTKP